MKRLPAWAPRFKSAHASPTLSLDVTQLEAVQAKKRDWYAVMDGLIHVGGGAIGLLERLALQVEGSSLFVDEFLRGLESLGHLQVRRDLDLQPVDFEYSANYVAGLPSGEYLLIGCWSRQQVSELRLKVRAAGGTLTSTREASGPTRHAVTSIPGDAVAELTPAVHDGTVVVEDAARQMLTMVDTLSSMRSALRTVFRPAAKRTERFDLASSSWVACDSVDRPGAYRLHASFRSTYVHVDEQELSAGTARRASAQLSKHLAAGASGRPLVAYDADQRNLFVPLGADLPGLMSRVAVLCSGRLPLVDVRRRAIVYREVPRDVAEGLTGLLAD